MNAHVNLDPYGYCRDCMKSPLLCRCTRIRPTAPAPPLLCGLPLDGLTLDSIDMHLKTLGLRSRASWRGGEWTVQLTARREEHQKNIGRRAFGRAALIEEAFARALEEWERTP